MKEFLAILVLFLISGLCIAADDPWHQDNCFFVDGSTEGAEPGYLCVEGLKQLVANSVAAGTRLEGLFYQEQSSRDTSLVAKIPLQVTFVDRFNVGRFAVLGTIVVEGSGDGYSAQMHFALQQSDNDRDALPFYSQRSGSLEGSQGRQSINRYVWEDSNLPPASHECNHPHCK